MAILNLPESASRAELREAAAALRALAAAGAPGAAAELEAVRARLRSGGGGGGPVKRRAAAVDAGGDAVEYPNILADCGGDWRDMESEAESIQCFELVRSADRAYRCGCRRPADCPDCGGGGILYGCEQSLSPNNPAVRFDGPWAAAGGRSGGNRAAVHSRIGGTLAVGAPGAGIDAIDRAAESEAAAIRQARRSAVGGPRGKRAGSRRDKRLLRAGGERRPDTYRRVRRYQAEAQAAARRARQAEERAEYYGERSAAACRMAGLRALRAVGAAV